MAENQQQQPRLCRANCGFFGSPATEDYCSKCFKDYIKRKQQTEVPPQRHSPTSAAATLMHQQPITPYSMVEPVKATISDVISAINEDGVKTTIISPASIDERSAFEATASVETLAADAVQTAVSSNASGDLDRGTTPLSSTDGIGNSAMISAPSTPLIPSQNEADRGGSAISDLRKSPPSAGPSGDQPKKPNRCQTCNRKVGLTGIPCRCGGLFCSEHRYSLAHNCTFDYKTMEREGLRKQNPVVISEKIERI